MPAEVALPEPPPRDQRMVDLLAELAGRHPPLHDMLQGLDPWQLRAVLADDPALAGRGESHHGAQGGGFAGPVAAQEPPGLAGGHFKAHPLQDVVLFYEGLHPVQG